VVESGRGTEVRLRITNKGSVPRDVFFDTRAPVKCVASVNGKCVDASVLRFDLLANGAQVPVLGDSGNGGTIGSSDGASQRRLSVVQIAPKATLAAHSWARFVAGNSKGVTPGKYQLAVYVPVVGKSSLRLLPVTVVPKTGRAVTLGEPSIVNEGKVSSQTLTQIKSAARAKSEKALVGCYETYSDMQGGPGGAGQLKLATDRDGKVKAGALSGFGETVAEQALSSCAALAAYDARLPDVNGKRAYEVVIPVRFDRR
jgi:hypothetical protein